VLDARLRVGEALEAPVPKGVGFFFVPQPGAALGSAAPVRLVPALVTRRPAGRRGGEWRRFVATTLPRRNP